VSKNLATASAWQGTRSAYRSQAQMRSESGVTPTIANNLDAAGGRMGLARCRSARHPRCLRLRRWKAISDRETLTRVF
jgi:hypothetical protein